MTERSQPQPKVYIAQFESKGDRILFGRGVTVPIKGGAFGTREPPIKGGKGICLYAGSRTETSAASAPF